MKMRRNHSIWVAEDSIMKITREWTIMVRNLTMEMVIILSQQRIYFLTQDSWEVVTIWTWNWIAATIDLECSLMITEQKVSLKIQSEAMDTSKVACSVIIKGLVWMAQTILIKLHNSSNQASLSMWERAHLESSRFMLQEERFLRLAISMAEEVIKMRGIRSWITQLRAATEWWESKAIPRLTLYKRRLKQITDSTTSKQTTMMNSMNYLRIVFRDQARMSSCLKRVQSLAGIQIKKDPKLKISDLPRGIRNPKSRDERGPREIEMIGARQEIELRMRRSISTRSGLNKKRVQAHSETQQGTKKNLR